MPDNTTLNVGSGGDVIATDDVTTLNGSASSGVKVQRVKIMHGADGTATDASASNPLPVSGPLTDTQMRASRINVEPLGVPGVARQLAAGASSANTALTASVGRVSIYARSADIRYAVGSTSQTASATSHFIAQGERLDIDVPSTPNIAVIRAGTTDGTLEVTELS